MNKEKSIELLNRAISEELTATNQYMYFHFRLSDMGYDLLASYFKRVAIKEMKHCEDFAERILYLKGEVIMAYADKTHTIHDVPGMLKKAREMEGATINDYNSFVKELAANEDAVTKRLFEKIIAEEDDHYDNFDTELDNLNNFGDQYLALQSLAHTKEIAKEK